MRMTCPHCLENAYTRTSLPVTNLTRETIFVCKNVQCGHVFSALTEISKTISPSAIPNPAVILPMSTHIKRKLLQTQLERAQSADVDFARHVEEDVSGPTTQGKIAPKYRSKQPGKAGAA